MTGAFEEDARITRRTEYSVGIVRQHEALDGQRTRIIVHHEEDTGATLASSVVADSGSFDEDVVVVAVRVDSAAAATTRCAGLGRFAPQPMAALSVMRLLITSQLLSMLLSPLPLEHRPP